MNAFTAIVSLLPAVILLLTGSGCAAVKKDRSKPKSWVYSPVHSHPSGSKLKTKL